MKVEADKQLKPLVPLKPLDTDLPVVKRVKEQGLIFDSTILNQHAQERRRLIKENSHKLHIKGYVLNGFPNRKSRRDSARNGGYFKVDHGSNSWAMYKAPFNHQTVIKDKKHSPAPILTPDGK